MSPKTRQGSENDFDSDASPSQTLSPKRGSIENLKKASRVKNSSMFAREQKYEYDPTAIQAPHRPLAAGRPLSTQIQGNAYGGSGLAGLRQQMEEHRSHRRGESLTKIPTLSPSKSSPSKMTVGTPPSLSSGFSTPPPGRMSPSKSSLASPSRFNSNENDGDSSIWSDDGTIQQQTPRPLRRHAKSVTFDAAPPIINEYEMVTPAPSSIASDSREGSFESEEEDLSFDQDDSFDASLEDTDKTPVVLPEDWRHMSPGAANASLADDYDDVFDDREMSPLPNARPNLTGQQNRSRHGSTTSDGESRPLPPLPGAQGYDEHRRRDSSVGLSAAAERASNRRSLPQLPQSGGFSKEDLLNMREGSMSLEDRLRLMHVEDDRDLSTPTQEDQGKKLELGVEVEVAELEDVTVSDIAEDDDGPKTPRISRESILRKVKSRTFDNERESNYDGESSPERSYGDLADLDPDVPIPSRECSSNFDENPAPSEADSVLDAYSFGDTTAMYSEMSPYHNDNGDDSDNDNDNENSVIHHESDNEDSVLDNENDNSVIHHEVEHESEDDDEISQYSPQPEEQPISQNAVDTSGPPTPTQENPASMDEDKEAKEAKEPELFASFNDKDMDLSLDPLKSSFQTALSPLDTPPKIDAMRQFLERPETPEAEVDSAPEEPSTPESVIRHPVSPSPPPSDVESVPEVEATIKGADGKLKTRPSLIPMDVDMAATRRQVSGEHPPPVPDRSPKRQSLTVDISNIEEEDSQASFLAKDNLRLNLDIGDDSNDLSFGLDKEFDNIIEAQKVSHLFPLPFFAHFPKSAVAQQDGASLNPGVGVVFTSDLANDSPPQQKGYLMRQNTKLVVASNRQFSDEKPSKAPVESNDKTLKPTAADARQISAERKPAWTTEPWNGKARRRSIRTTSDAKRAASSGPVPPMPGQESAAAGGLDAVNEQGDDFEDGQERGRVFVKVVGVKDLDLPLPKSECPPLFRLQ